MGTVPYQPAVLWSLFIGWSFNPKDEVTPFFWFFYLKNGVTLLGFNLKDGVQKTV